MVCCGRPFHMAKRMRVCREHHRPDNKCMAMATPGSDRCDRHHLEAFTRQRKVNRQLGLCGCGAQPDPGLPHVRELPGMGELAEALPA